MAAAAPAANRLAIDGLTRPNPIQADPPQLGPARGTRIRPKNTSQFLRQFAVVTFLHLGHLIT